jgi:tripartite-type tricarboxylate transporter receptor subunit TctC
MRLKLRSLERTQFEETLVVAFRTGLARLSHFATVLVVAAPVVAFAQAGYPNRTIRIVVPIPPGPVADVLPRLLAEKLSSRWGQPVIVENRPGGALNLGAEAVARATPDGYTLLATPPSPLAINQSFFPKLAFDPTAFVPVSIFASLPYVVVVGPKVPVSTLQEFIAYARANPNKINFASGGTGGGPHLTGEMLSLAASIRMVQVPYSGLGPAMTDLLAGHVDLMVDNLGNVLPRVREGKLKALGVGSETRIPELPDVPAIAELFPGFRAMAWFAIVAPPKTPPDIAAKISEAVAETLRLPDVAKRFRDLSVSPVGSSPAETAAFLKDETERWRKVIVAGGIKPH